MDRLEVQTHKELIFIYFTALIFVRSSSGHQQNCPFTMEPQTAAFYTLGGCSTLPPGTCEHVGPVVQTAQLSLYCSCWPLKKCWKTSTQSSKLKLLEHGIQFSPSPCPLNNVLKSTHNGRMQPPHPSPIQHNVIRSQMIPVYILQNRHPLIQADLARLDLILLVINIGCRSFSFKSGIAECRSSSVQSKLKG